MNNGIAAIMGMQVTLLVVKMLGVCGLSWWAVLTPVWVVSAPPVIFLVFMYVSYVLQEWRSETEDA
jgi:hypothetical protein